MLLPSPKILELDKNRNNVVLSRRQYLEETQSEVRETFLSQLKKGESLEQQYYDVLDSGFEETLNEWRQLSVTLGEDIEVRAPGNTYEGVATDIDEDGNLLVRIPDGTVKRVMAGDVSIRPRK